MFATWAPQAVAAANVFVMWHHLIRTRRRIRGAQAWFEKVGAHEGSAQAQKAQGKVKSTPSPMTAALTVLGGG